MIDPSIVSKAYIVSGMPHILLAKDDCEGFSRLNHAYQELAADISQQDADLILYFSTQWLSILGYMFQARPNPEWVHVDQNWHQLGEIPYRFNVDADFAQKYAEEVDQLGYTTRLIDYHGFPIDTATVVAQKLLNPDNRLPAAMVSCNMYAEKTETTAIGAAASRALAKAGKKAIVVLVSNLSNRYLVEPYQAKKNRISANKDHEWNRKILEMLADGNVEDVAQCAREFAKQANADMQFKGIWWLNGLLGQHNQFHGVVKAYEPVWGCGAALVSLQPEVPIQASPDRRDHSEEGSQAEMVEELTDFEGRTTPEKSGTTAPEQTASTTPRPVSAAGHYDQEYNAAAGANPVGNYPHARRWGDCLYLSGIGPRKPDSTAIPGVVFDSAGHVQSYDIVAQTKSVIENVEVILQAAGSDFSKVLDVQVFLVNMKDDFKAFNEVYNEAFKTIRPTRTTVEVGALPTPIAVEFKVIARA
jgi:2-aminophenol/2-amino-5-chlorophenol 1,6-dioxygenase alpha subunit